MVGSAGYYGSTGHHLLIVTNANRARGANKNFGNGLQFTSNYEWTKSMDINSLGSQGGAVLPYSNNPSENNGLFQCH